jgi:hypothetical protein
MIPVLQIFLLLLFLLKCLVYDVTFWSRDIGGRRTSRLTNAKVIDVQ